MQKRSTFVTIVACWLLATHPVAEGGTSNVQLYHTITGEGNQALCAANVPSQQYAVKSSIKCMAECLQFPGCTGANFVNQSACQMYGYFPNAFSPQAGCRHHQVRSCVTAERRLACRRCEEITILSKIWLLIKCSSYNFKATKWAF